MPSFQVGLGFSILLMIVFIYLFTYSFINCRFSASYFFNSLQGSRLIFVNKTNHLSILQREQQNLTTSAFNAFKFSVSNILYQNCSIYIYIWNYRSYFEKQCSLKLSSFKSCHFVKHMEPSLNYQVSIVVFVLIWYFSFIEKYL